MLPRIANQIGFNYSLSTDVGSDLPHIYIQSYLLRKEYLFLQGGDEFPSIVCVMSRRTSVLRRYRFRAYPTGGQEQSLARLFGCVRVVFNDVVAAREDAFKNSEPFLSSAELSRRLTESKRTTERAWLSEVSSVPLQQ